MADSPFIEGTQIQFAWDATSLGLLKECPQKYFLQIIEGWRPKGSSRHLVFGGHYAKALERFHRWKAEFNLTTDEAMILTVWALLQDSYGWESHDTAKNRDTLVRSVVWYLETYRDDVARTLILDNGNPAVELSYRWDTHIPADKDHTYVLSGHLDRVVDFDGTSYIQDQKTTGGTLSPYWFNQFNPDNQMTNYTIAGQVVFHLPVKGVMIDAAQIAVGFTRFQRGLTLRSEGQLEEWFDDYQVWMETARRYAIRGYWPHQEKSCTNYGGCAFQGVCGKDPKVRKYFLETDFEKRFWNPLEIR